MEHSHVMGGSTCERRINCPGSLEAEKEIPDGEPSEFAERGSMLHAGTELLVTADPQDEKELEKLLGELKGQDLGFEGHEVTEELVDTKLRPAMYAWWDLIEKYDLDDWFIEQRVSLESIIPGAFGTADIIAKGTDRVLHIIDWKFGDGVPVPAVENLGLGFYAGAALFEEDEELIEFCDDIDENKIMLHIVQPREGDSQIIHSWETNVAWIEDLITLAEARIDIARKPDAPRTPGKWCRFCKAQAVCPAYGAMASDALSVKPEGALSEIELAKLLNMADLLEGWCRSVYEHAQNQAEGGVQIPGYKLVNKRGRRVYTDRDEAEARLRKAKKSDGKAVRVGDIFEKTMLSPAKAEKLLGKKEYERVLGDIVVMHSSGLTLVDESDRRQAVVSGVELLANALPEQETG